MIIRIADQPIHDTSLEQRLNMTYWQWQLFHLLSKAESDGIVLTVETKSKLPPAMGNYDLVVSARVKRGSK